MLSCTRCEGSGFLNVEQIEDTTVHDGGHEAISQWIKENDNHDVELCDCCSDGVEWYGEPGEHYSSDDPAGRGGPYEYNGGLCECN